MIVPLIGCGEACKAVSLTSVAITLWAQVVPASALGLVINSAYYNYGNHFKFQIAAVSSFRPPSRRHRAKAVQSADGAVTVCSGFGSAATRKEKATPPSILEAVR